MGALTLLYGVVGATIEHIGCLRGSVVIGAILRRAQKQLSPAEYEAWEKAPINIWDDCLAPRGALLCAPCARVFVHCNAKDNLWMEDLDYQAIVLAIKDKTGENQLELAARFEVSQPTVSRWLGVRRRSFSTRSLLTV